jgi:hypothetical protein
MPPSPPRSAPGCALATTAAPNRNANTINVGLIADVGFMPSSNPEDAGAAGGGARVLSNRLA